NDLDAIEAFGRAISKGGHSSFHELIADLSGPNIRIAYDLFQLDPDDPTPDAIPFEMHDRDRKVYAPAGPPGTIAGSGIPPLYATAADTRLPGKFECGFGNPVALQVSEVLRNIYASAQPFLEGTAILVAVTLFVVGWVLRAFRNDNPLQELFGVPLTAGLVTAGYFYVAESLVGSGFVFAIAVAIFWILRKKGARRAQSARLRVAYYSSVPVLLLGILPFFGNLLWAGGVSACLLVPSRTLMS
ncbi:MAG: hypothetical protein JO209_06080, partial [Acidisphaera sp.]|nr:hypothetical protein [Acidisphaera sp.]